MASYLHAASLLSVGRPHDAMEAALAGLSDSPDDPMLLSVLAEAQIEIEPKEAIQPAERAAELAPDDPQILRTLVYTYWRAEKLKKAADAATRLRELAPEMPEAHSFTAGILLQRSGQFGGRGLTKRDMRRALESAAKGVELAPGWVGGHLIRGRIQLADDDISGTNRSAQAALRINPDDAGASHRSV